MERRAAELLEQHREHVATAQSLSLARAHSQLLHDCGTGPRCACYTRGIMTDSKAGQCGKYQCCMPTCRPSSIDQNQYQSGTCFETREWNLLGYACGKSFLPANEPRRPFARRAVVTTGEGRAPGGGWILCRTVQRTSHTRVKVRAGNYFGLPETSAKQVTNRPRAKYDSPLARMYAFTHTRLILLWR